MLKKICKFLLGKDFYNFEAGRVYQTHDNSLIAYENKVIHFQNHHGMYLIDVSKIEKESITIAKEIDIFENIFNMSIDNLKLLRDEYTDKGEYEVSDFLNKHIKRRTTNG